MIRVVVVDDERPARPKLVKLFAAERDVALAGEAGDGDEAVALIRRVAPDLVFLDVQMPRLDGFGVIEAIGVEAMPRVVFVTAFDEHALRAFEVHAFDYLVKPFAPSRLHRVLDRVRAERALAAPPKLGRRLEELLGHLAPAPRYLQRVMVARSEGREVLLPVDRIDVVRADGNYLKFHTAERVFTRRGTLNGIAGRLDAEKFLRINRGEIVRLDAVREFQPWFHGDYRVVMPDGAMLSWSRRYRAQRDDALEP